MSESLRAAALNCTLKSGAAPSSTDKLLGEILVALKAEGVVGGPVVRVADHDVKPGVTSDEGEGDAWPTIRQQIIDADILVLGTPIWLGQPWSIAKRVLERMDAFLGETDDQGRMVSFGRVAIVAVVGNEDGAHHVCAELYQALKRRRVQSCRRSCHLLGRRGHAGRRLQGQDAAAGKDRLGDCFRRPQRCAPCEAPSGKPVSGSAVTALCRPGQSTSATEPPHRRDLNRQRCRARPTANSGGLTRSTSPPSRDAFEIGGMSRNLLGRGWTS